MIKGRVGCFQVKFKRVFIFPSFSPSFRSFLSFPCSSPPSFARLSFPGLLSLSFSPPPLSPPPLCCVGVLFGCADRFGGCAACRGALLFPRIRKKPFSVLLPGFVFALVLCGFISCALVYLRASVAYHSLFICASGPFQLITVQSGPSPLKVVHIFR